MDAGGAVALDDGCCPERGAAAPGHPKKATGGVRQAVILSEATVGSEVEGSRAAPAESVREYEPLAVEGRLGYHFVKRAFDIVFSACATIVGLIPVALLCLVIRLESPGSPIYLQERVGYRGKPLRILKLRTMVADSDDVEKHLSPEPRAQGGRRPPRHACRALSAQDLPRRAPSVSERTRRPDPFAHIKNAPGIL